ncbi:MAG TPA: amidohydrolase family protein [Acidimicrobiia bacterium]|nr:amidohydrolase family protein [Acidimicrobiia bacterium]
MNAAADLTAVFDADNHYWETSDSFTRHRSAEFAERGVTVREVDGRLRYWVNDDLHPWIPGPGDANPRPRPGGYLQKGATIKEMLAVEDPGQHPEWFRRDARLPLMDAQGVEACFMFPSQGVCMEGVMQPDIAAIVDIFRAFNRWIDDEWGFAYRDRIFAAPYLTLSDLDAAVEELGWVLDHGARIVALRPGPVLTPEGWKSPADPVFDPFWARVAEARLVVACHPGFDDGYRDVENAVARSWGYASRRKQGEVSSLNFYEPVVGALMGHRLIQDFMAVVTAHGLFERHPGLRIASIENGVEWLPGTLKVLARLSGRGGLDATGTRLVEEFTEHVWVTPFTHDDVPALLDVYPVERVLFGSDYPHAEGFAEPKQFLTLLEGVSADDQRRIMRDNARELVRR